MIGSSFPVIMVHGGAWGIPDHMVDGSKAGVQAAAVLGYRLLKDGRSALDAVEMSVRLLEDNPLFDSGHGSALTAAGEVEMDAVIMDGRDLKAGAVACVKNISHPVSLARMVLEKTDHCLLVGTGANAFAHEMGMPEVSADELITESARQELEMYLKFKNTLSGSFKQRSMILNHDTVGVVAMDVFGNLACGTSTGGITAKRPGRVGDSPIIGSGAYCDNEVGAVSSTGHGEAIMRVCLAERVVELMRQGLGAQAAAESGISFMSKRVNGTGGVIVLNKDGEFGRFFSTERMVWASIKNDMLHYGINPEDDFSLSVESYKLT